MDTLMQDLRYAVRSLAARPGFTAVAVLTLVLGIGANTAIFSVVDGVLLRPLPYESPDRVVRLVPYHRETGEGDLTFSYLDVLDLRERDGVFAGVAAQTAWRPTLMRDDGAVRLDGAFVSADYFRVLGVRPAAGRFFLPQEDEPGGSRSVVIAHGLWRRAFGGDPGVVGSTIRLGTTAYTVVGIAPADFEDPGLGRGGAGAPEVWHPTPAFWTRGRRAERGTRFLTAVARLRPGVSLERAQATASGLAATLERAYPESHAGWNIRLVPLKDRIVAPVRPALLTLLAAVGLVLLIACANLANLLLARAAGRRREIAVRLAMGASRRRIVRQLLVESVLLALVGGMLGLFATWLARDLIVALGAGQLPRLDRIAVDGRVLAFTAAVATLTGVLFGLAPALRAARTELRPSLGDGDRGAAGGRSQARFRGALVAAQVALTVILLAGAGLLIRSLQALYGVDPGLEADGVLTMQISPPYNGYETDARVHDLYDRLLAETAALPGVEIAGATNILPFSGGYWRTSFVREGRPAPERREDAPGAEFRTATPGLFDALRSPILRGRAFREGDRAGSPPVVVINETLAQRYFAGEDPLGQRVVVGDVSREIVGIAADVRQFALDSPPGPVLYLPLAQSPNWLTANAYVVLRAARDPLALAPAARAIVRRIDARIPVSELATMERVIAETAAQPRFRTLLLALLAALAFALAAIGVYGVVAYGVAQRVREIGIRIALGARAREVGAMVIRQGMRPVLIGVALGMLGAVAAGRLLADLLFGVSATDPVTFAAVPALLAAAAALASWLPARRAARVDPMRVLRQE